jgi:transposase-like protein
MTSRESKQDELIEQLLAGCDDPDEILGKQGLLHQLQKKLVERALDAELEDHLGYPRHERKGTSNSRNGKTKKTVKTDSSALEIEVPRDRDGSFEPQLVKKRQRRLAGFDEKVLAFYARGMSTREIQSQLEEIYDIEVSPTLISNVTHAVLDEVKAWQSRPLASVYPILYFDAIFVKSRQDGPVKNKPNDESILKIFYLALNNVAKKWTMPIRDWRAALNQFIMMYGDRVHQLNC